MMDALARHWRCPSNRKPAVLAMDQRSQDGVQDAIEVLAQIRRKKAQDEIPVLLEQHILPPVPPV